MGELSWKRCLTPHIFKRLVIDLGWKVQYRSYRLGSQFVARSRFGLLKLSVTESVWINIYIFIYILHNNLRYCTVPRYSRTTYGTYSTAQPCRCMWCNISWFCVACFPSFPTFLRAVILRFSSSLLLLIFLLLLFVVDVDVDVDLVCVFFVVIFCVAGDHLY